ncbi:MAG: hypothetical protein E6J69_15565 [Deltaproteobacteria bacterium]|nr:MAG: hypothetical protein E6J69_15565 [Deltaproteobacteria bacterium]
MVVNVSPAGVPPAQVQTPGNVDDVLVELVGVVVVLVDVVVVLLATVVLVVVVAPQGRFCGRGWQTSMTSSESTVGVALRAHAITRSCCRPGRSGPNGPRWAATATASDSPQVDFVRSSPAASPENRGGATLTRARPSRGGRHTGMSGSFWFRQRRMLNPQKPLPHTPSWSHGSPSTHSTRGGCELGIAVMPSNSA